MNAPVALAAVFFVLLLPFSGHGSEPKREPLIDAPREIAGSTVADWVAFFGSDYRIVEPEAARSPHDDSPVVYFQITDGVGTTARFGVNLISNRHMLVEVESTSPEFVSRVGADRLVNDECLDAGASYCAEFGCDLVHVSLSSNGDYSAVWKYDWD